MRSTFFQHGNAYASPMWAGAEIADGTLRLKIRMPRPMAKLFGVRHRTFEIDEIDTVEVVRHPVNFRKRTHVIVDGEVFQFSSWVGEELIRTTPRLNKPTSS